MQVLRDVQTALPSEQKQNPSVVPIIRRSLVRVQSLGDTKICQIDDRSHLPVSWDGTTVSHVTVR